MKLFGVIMNTCEFVVNLFGINTQENPNRTKFVKHLDVSDGFDTGLSLAVNVVEQFQKDPAPRTLLDVFRPDNDGKNFEFHTIFKFMEEDSLKQGFKDPDSSMAFVLSQKAVLLPDNISEYLQINYGMHTYDLVYTSVFRETQFWLHGLCLAFLTLWGLNNFLSFCLFINPYEFPFVLLTTLMDPIIYGIEAIFPTILGWNVGFIVLGVVAGIGMDYVANLSLTMPYLPSEATIQAVDDMNSFYIFSGIPYLWQVHGIPEELRRDWFDQNNIGIMQYYLRMLPPDWDVLPADLGRLRVLALEGDIDIEDIKRAVVSTVRNLKSMGATPEEVQKTIEEAVKFKVRYE